jgi:hypothetical protein
MAPPPPPPRGEVRSVIYISKLNCFSSVIFLQALSATGCLWSAFFTSKRHNPSHRVKVAVHGESKSLYDRRSVGQSIIKKTRLFPLLRQPLLPRNRPQRKHSYSIVDLTSCTSHYIHTNIHSILYIEEDTSRNTRRCSGFCTK